MAEMIGAVNTTASDPLLSNSNQEIIEKKQKERDDVVWMDKAKSTLLSFATSDADVLDFMIKTLNDPNVSEARKQAIQYLLSLRTEIATLISNLMRQLFDGANAIIRNIRA